MSGGALAVLIVWMKTAQAAGLLLAAVEGLDPMAWVAPLAVFGAALVGTILLVRRWSRPKTQTRAQISDPAMNALKEKIRRETEDSE